MTPITTAAPITTPAAIPALTAVLMPPPPSAGSGDGLGAFVGVVFGGATPHKALLSTTVHVRPRSQQPPPKELGHETWLLEHSVVACGRKPLGTAVGNFRQADVAQTSPYAQQPLPISCGHRKELVEHPLGQHAEIPLRRKAIIDFHVLETVPRLDNAAEKRHHQQGQHDCMGDEAHGKIATVQCRGTQSRETDQIARKNLG
ncbi:hypothetical protein PpBr36_08373 [Pyricularia pennisetigena]|uniref:hypothetical protein n=1 Tax=Pyricularia pennisetigena TaxID=1578925 RepID=UPI001152727F|nr:hypothetical protein PpBr36_08373 [Pyricularia pennisetigena]TLS24676.1 hypothetical protein PpBr36_08373 [Pyricularia pennisetigena]